MSRPSVIVAPHFRRMAEIFDDPTLDRLFDLAEIVWGRDGPMPVPAFRAAVADAEGIVFGTWHYGRDALVRAGPNLRAVLEVAGGHAHPDLDYDTCFARGIPVGSCAPAFGPVVAEMGLALTLAATRAVAQGDRDFREGDERYLHDGNATSTSLYGATVGFVGCGGLSRALQPLLAPFDVRIVGYDPWLGDDDFATRGIERVPLEVMFDTSDVVYVLAVPTPANAGLVSRSLLERLAPHAALIVMSRAHLVDFDALTNLLLAGRFKAGIDVFPAEPLPASHPIRRAPRTVLSAHRAGAMPGALLEIGRMVVDDLEAVLGGGQPVRMQYATPEMRRGIVG